MDRLIIHTLGEFSICYRGKEINEQSKRSRKIWALLQYLITFHNREISQNELIELLWPGGESTNPSGALKTQLYRLRTMLNESGLPGDEIIVNTAGTYAFNDSLDCEIDSDLFEQSVKQSAACYSEKEKLAAYMKAIDIYRGDFLTGSTESWVVPINAYYHTMYTRVVRSTLEILSSFKRYGEMVEICRKAMKIERLDETIHAYYMRALLESGDKEAAKAHYLYVLDLFYNHEGINPSQEFIALYGEIVKSENNYGADVSAVRIEMEEKGESEGAFYCEYDAFKHIYQLEVRESRREGRTVYLCVITASDCEEGKTAQKQQNRAMQRLQKTIAGCLRTSDVYSRFSATQFVMVFPGANEQICENIMRRIIRHFKRDNPKSKTLLMYSYERADKPKDGGRESINER